MQLSLQVLFSETGMMMNNPNELIQIIQKITDESDFLKKLASYKSGKKSRLFGDDVRRLSDHEISMLESQGNRAENWDDVLVAEGFSAEHIYFNHFLSDCVLGVFSGKPVAINDNLHMPCGIYHSTIGSCEIGSDSLVGRVSIVDGYYMESGSVLFDCGPILFVPDSYMGNGVPIALGNENECRAVSCFAEITVPIAHKIAVGAGPQERERYHNQIDAYVQKCGMSKGVISTGARICFGSVVKNSFIGDGAVVDRAEVDNSSVLSSISEVTRICGDAKVRESCIQWGCEVDSFAYVESSVLCEHSHVERHGKVHSSIIGPNTGIAEGEVTSGLLGPFIGFHHQALLIASIWPEGKGNVGYGANVGSNHTGKSPDQEIICGEGLFFGLGVNIKFPSNFADSPYTIIATGVNTLPQKVRFPFSLINKPLHLRTEIPPAYNEIYPGWMLSDNIFAIMRNEIKYRKRDKSKRMDIPYDVFRPEIISLMLDAKRRLERIDQTKDFYTEKDIPGTGKNFLLERSRKQGISAYAFYIEYYLMRGLFERAEILFQKHGAIDKQTLYEKEPTHTYWNNQYMLMNEFAFFKRSVVENLSRFDEMVHMIARKTESVKEKDEGRGKKIIDDYNLYHTPAGEDDFVKEMHATADSFSARVSVLREAVKE